MGRGKQKQKQNTSKTQLSSFITTNCSQNMSAVRKISAASKSFDIIKAGEMCQSLSFLPDGGVCYFHIWLLMDKQASLPGKQGSKLRKQTNKSNHALDMEASDRYDWSGVQLEAVTTKLRETGRAWHVSRAKDYRGVLGR